MKKKVWMRADVEKGAKALVTTALEASILDIVLNAEDLGLSELGRFRAMTIEDGRLLSDGEVVGLYVEIAGPEDVDRVVGLAEAAGTVLVDSRDWKVIPLENIIAALQGKGVEVIATARTPEEAVLFLETLEKGVEGVAIRTEEPSEVEAFLNAIRGEGDSIELTPATVTKVSSLGSGDRVCVDTCSLMVEGEGMLVGSQSGCLFLVQSESMESGYVSSRPFRVNAGAVHAYVLGPEGRTRYLSEIQSGDTLIAVDRNGNTREVIVGRAKVELRPMLMVEVEIEGRRHSTILQNAETIRLCTEEGSIPVSELKPGDEVLVRFEGGGRHFGMRVEETIEER